MLWVPAANVLVAKVATPELFNVPVPREVVPSRNVTVPVGMVELPEGAATVAVKVRFCPTVAEEALDERTVVVEASVPPPPPLLVAAWLNSTTDPDKMSGLPSPFRSRATVGPPTPT